MNKLGEATLNTLAVRFSGKYIEERFKGGSEVEKNLVLNCVAHGFCMGYRHSEKTRDSFWSKIFPRNICEEWIETHAVKAGNYYLIKKGYLKLEWSEQALIRACVSTGFLEGFKSLG